MADEIALCPLTGWTTATLPDGHAMVEIEYVTDPKHLATGTRRGLRLAMTAAQCDELAEVLRRAASKSRERQKSGG